MSKNTYNIPARFLRRFVLGEWDDGWWLYDDENIRDFKLFCERNKVEEDTAWKLNSKLGILSNTNDVTGDREVGLIYQVCSRVDSFSDWIAVNYDYSGNIHSNIPKNKDSYWLSKNPNDFNLYLESALKREYLLQAKDPKERMRLDLASQLKEEWSLISVRGKRLTSPSGLNNTVLAVKVIGEKKRGGIADWESWSLHFENDLTEQYVSENYLGFGNIRYWKPDTLEEEIQKLVEELTKYID